MVPARELDGVLAPAPKRSCPVPEGGRKALVLYGVGVPGYYFFDPLDL